jgi:hypothetical protein
MAGMVGSGSCVVRSLLLLLLLLLVLLVRLGSSGLGGSM